MAGCIAGAVIANLMFALPAVSISAKHRATPAHFLSEVVATLGLILVIFALARSGRSRTAPAAVGAYIGAAYFFTSSTSFANPGDHHRPHVLRHLRRHRPLLGASPSSPPRSSAAPLALVVIQALYPTITPAQAADIIFPHQQTRPDQRPPGPPTMAPPRQHSGPVTASPLTNRPTWELPCTWS